MKTEGTLNVSDPVIKPGPTDPTPVVYDPENPDKIIIESQEHKAQRLIAEKRTKDAGKEGPETQAQKDAKIWREAEKKHKEDQIKAGELRMKEAAEVKIAPDHPLHPSKATNPTNLTFPADHGPGAKVYEMGQGEP